jgi:hypothetical protein
MSVLSFPRIHVKGLLEINVGTANNDDYSSLVIYEGKPLRLADSVKVQPLTYGMPDDQYIHWIQEVGSFEKKPAPAVTADLRRGESHHVEPERMHYIPAEWNYYGDMRLDMMDVNVLNVQYHPQDQQAGMADDLIGAELTFKENGRGRLSRALLIDVNPEDVPSSQIFVDFLALRKGSQIFMNAKPSKAVTRWINFQRNTCLNGPNGAAAYFYCTIPSEALSGQPILDLMTTHKDSSKTLKGVVFRYYIYRPLQKINVFKYPATNEGDPWFTEMEALYREKGLNPDYAELLGTISPWYEGEIMSAPTARILDPTQNTIPVSHLTHKPNCKSNGPAFRLAPAVLTVNTDQKLISVDFCATFPDEYMSSEYDPIQTDDNPKIDFGPLILLLQTEDNQTVEIGVVDYQDTEAGDQKGWVFDFPIDDPKMLDGMRNGRFILHHPEYGDLLAETEYQIVSDQSCIFAEQGKGKTDLFTNDSGLDEPATIRVFHKGVELTEDNCPPITVWEYDTTPNQDPGKRNLIQTSFKPGSKLVVDTSQAGNRLYTFTFASEDDPPEEYGKLDQMTVPQINLRILPNEDYRAYYIDPTVADPVGNDKLTFDDVVYPKVLRNYYLLYPAMSRIIQLNDEEQWSQPNIVQSVLNRTDKNKMWEQYHYMPRTRDLSESRRQLLRAWCHKILATQGGN